MAKIGVNQAGSGQPVLNWITSAWFILVTNFVKKHFVTQNASFAKLVAMNDVSFYDIHVRLYRGILYVSNGLFLFDLKLSDALAILRTKTTPHKYRIVYDDLLPNSIWRPKFFRKVEAIDIEVVNKIVNFLKLYGFSSNCLSVTLASNVNIGVYFNDKVRYYYPDRVYAANELSQFLAWLQSTPPDVNAIIFATPNETIPVGKFLSELPYVPDSAQFAKDIFTWVTQQTGREATYVLNHV
jgi:hypothetical protein